MVPLQNEHNINTSLDISCSRKCAVFFAGLQCHHISASQERTDGLMWFLPPSCSCLLLLVENLPVHGNEDQPGLIRLLPAVWDTLLLVNLSGRQTQQLSGKAEGAQKRPLDRRRYLQEEHMVI